jgi:trimethylamine corrinoid protein
MEAEMAEARSEKTLAALEETMILGDPGTLKPAMEDAIEEGVNPREILDVVGRAMDRVSEMWDRLEIWLPDVVRIGAAMKDGLGVLQPHLESEEQGGVTQGTVVLGTVEGDIHDIGRNVVGTLLMVNGFDVFDLGHDISAEEFIDKAEEVSADLIGLSALMTTSMPFQEDVLDLLRDRDLKGRFNVLIGGGPVTVDWMKEIGADAYARTALDAVKAAKRLMAEERDADGFVVEGELT